MALQLFTEQGYDETTVDDIAVLAGISRRTFFRYYTSKVDVVWGDFDALLHDLETWLAECDDDVPLLDVVREAVVRFNTFPADAVAAHRRRMALILHVPALQANSTLRYAAWRDVVTAFAARRLQLPPAALLPSLVGHVALAAAVTAYEQWLADGSADLGALLRQTFDAIHLQRVS